MDSLGTRGCTVPAWPWSAASQSAVWGLGCEGLCLVFGVQRLGLVFGVQRLGRLREVYEGVPRLLGPGAPPRGGASMRV